jgi:O-antigen ligase
MIARAGRPSWAREIITGGLASLLVALSNAASPVMGLAVAGGAAVLCIGLFSPAALVLAWIGAGPTLSTWLDVNVGPLPNLTPDRALLLVLLSVTALRWLRRPWTRLPLGRIEQLMVCFLVVAAASAIAGGGTRQTNLAVMSASSGSLKLDLVFLTLSYGLPFLAFFLTKNLLQDERHVRWLLRTFIAVGVFVAMTGILQYYTGITIFMPTRMEVIHEGRATGTMTSAPEFGLVVGIPLLIALICFLRSRYVPERLPLAAVILFMGVAIVLSKTRTIWVGIVVGLAVAALYERGLRRRLAAVAITAALAGAAAWPFVANSEFITGRVMDMTPVYNRVINTATAVNMFVHSPLVGFGFGRYTYDSEKWDYITGVGGVSPYYGFAAGVPHNEYMHVLVLLGLMGSIPYGAILVLAWRMAARHYRTRFDLAGPRRDLALMFLSAFGLYLATALTVDAFAFGYASIQIYALAGALEGLRVREAVVA